MLQLLIKDASVSTTRINGKNGAFESSSQHGWIELPSGERRKIRIRLPKEGKPYNVGAYTIGDESFTVSEYGDLQVGNLQLVAVAPSMQKAG